MGYKIDGRVGMSDCFGALCCTPCSAVQLLNEVDYRGPKTSAGAPSPYMAPEKNASCLGDPCDFCMTCACSGQEIAGLFSAFSGVPLWFSFCSANLCSTKNLMRHSYEIEGDDCSDDCCKPLLCYMIPVINCIYIYKQIATMRAEIQLRGRRK